MFDETHGDDITDYKSKVKLGAKVADKSEVVVKVDDEIGDKTDDEIGDKTDDETEDKDETELLSVSLVLGVGG